jgi:hypothetical protein
VSEIQQLLDQGLHHYGLGEVKRAAQLWMELLARDPAHREAQRYLDYLRDQRPEAFEGLEIQSVPAAAAPVATSAGEDWASGVPVEGEEGPAFGVAAPRGMAPPVGDPFDLLGTNARDPLIEGALDLYGLNDFEGALQLVHKAEAQGQDDARLKQLREQCEAQLIKLYEARLGDLQQTPRTKVQSSELVWLNLDHRAGFVLSLVDGTISYDELFALSGMPKLETARVVAQLVRDGIIGT